MRQAKRLLEDRGARRTILYLWRPNLEFGLDAVPHDLSCFHIDDEYTFSNVELPLSEQERRVVTRVDQVIIHSPALLEKKGHLNPHTAHVPNGVDYAAYSAPTVEPDDLRAIPHPRIGYVGVIKTQLDLPLVARLAARHPTWSFVFVGPVHVQGEVVEALVRLHNVHFLGAKPVSALPAYTQHVDVCMMCYAVNDYTKYIYPLKLHEYLATGRPVVGTPIRSLQGFSDVVTLASSTDEWSQALQQALAPEATAPAITTARRRVAQEHDWDRLVTIIARTFCERLGPRELKRFSAIPR
jgi:glycosyltransferase involved in cell wall biosynthesis